MTISRGQMPRQLYEAGSMPANVEKMIQTIMEMTGVSREEAIRMIQTMENPQETLSDTSMMQEGYELEPRQQYGLGSIVKSVTKAVKGVGDAVGDFVSSDIGKAALLAAGAYYAPTMFGAKAGFSSYPSIFGAAKNIALSKLPQTALGKGTAILGGSALLTSLFGSPDQAQAEFERNPGYVKDSLKKYYKNINQNASDEEVEEFVNKNMLEFGDVSRGDVVKSYSDYYGRNMAAEGGLMNTYDVYQNYLSELSNPIYSGILTNPTVATSVIDGEESTTVDPTSSSFGRRGMRETITDTIANIKGGRFNPKKGFMSMMMTGNPIGGFTSGRSHVGVDDVNEDSVSPDASAGGAAGAAAASAAGSNDGPDGGTFADGGIPSIPLGELRRNMQGVTERDYREEGGFVPVGIKEKADDVPAMLSKNEFVMTADAVRGAGNGSVEKGAQKMYNLMKSLENRIV